METVGHYHRVSPSASSWSSTNAKSCPGTNGCVSLRDSSYNRSFISARRNCDWIAADVVNMYYNACVCLHAYSAPPADLRV